MNFNDEELQRKIESGLPDEGSVDARAYREVFNALSTEPKSSIAPNFADKVVSRVVAKNQKSEARDYFWLGFGLVFLLIGFVVALLVVGPVLNFGFLKDMSGYAGLFAFGAGIIIAFNWLDKRILQKNSNPESGVTN